MNTYFLTGEEYDLQYQGYKEDLPFYLSEIKKARSALEIGCGTGRILLPALKVGANIEGLDGSPGMLKTLHKKAKTAGLKPKTYLADMQKFSLGKKYDLIIIPFRAFLHVHTVSGQIRTLKNVCKHLAPKGRLIINFFNPDYRRMIQGQVKKEFHTFVKDPVTKNKVKIEAKNYYSPSEQTLKSTFIHQETSKTGLPVGKKEFTTKLRYIFRFEFEHLLALTGFKPLALYGDFKRGKFTDKSREMVWVAAKA